MKRLQKILQKTALSLAAILLVLTPAFQVPVNAVDGSFWMNGDLSYEVEGGADDSHGFGLTCDPADIKYEASPIHTDYTSENDCLFPLEYGGINRTGTIFMPKMAAKGGKLYQSKSRLIPVPHTSTMYRQGHRNDIYGTRYIDMYKGGLVKRQWQNINNSSYMYSLQLSQAEHKRVTWDDGRELIIMSGQLAVSSNGKWMIARADSGNIVRINLETLEVLTGYASGGGWPNPRGDYQLAISDDGTHGVVSGGFSSGGDTTKIIDFTTCDTSAEQTGEVTPGCGIRDITPFIKEIGDGETGEVIFPAFNTDNTQIQMNAWKDGAWKRIALIAPGEEYSGLDYLAMGDSFASGEGDIDDRYYEEGTDEPVSDTSPEGEKCHISKRSYPYLLAQKMNVSSGRFKSVACSGAKMVDVLNKSDDGKGRYEGQFKQFELLPGDEPLRMEKEKALNNFIPGRAAQIEFVEKYEPKIVTISIGGNDVGFVDVIKSCAIFGSQCDYAADDPSHRSRKAVDVQNKMNELAELYKKIHEASKNTKIYVLGYSKIIHKSGTCHPLFGFDDKERHFVDEAFSYMNDVVEAAAKKAGVSYLDTEDAIGKAGLCGSEEPKAANGLKFGDDLAPIPNLRIIGAESYHPNHHGHAKVANKIASYVNFEPCAPTRFICPQSIEPPDIPDYFVDSDNTTGEHQPSLFSDLTDKALYLVKDTLRIQQRSIFMPGSQVTLGLYSEPKQLGAYTVDDQGSVDISSAIPEETPAGYHTLRLKGTLLSGEEVEFYQSVLILGHDGDRDNNGTSDLTQECLQAPAAITNDDGKIILKPCGQIDEIIPEAPGDADATTPPEGNEEETIQQKIELLWQRISQNNYFQRFNSSLQRTIQKIFEGKAKPRMKRLLAECSTQSTEKLMLNIQSFKVVLSCQYREGKFYIKMSLYVALFRIFNVSVVI